MKNEQCPICNSELEVIECAPCYECGNLSDEIEHFKEGKHKYNIYNIYKGLKLHLCDFCDVDFGSHTSEYLGFDNNQRIGFENFEFIDSVSNPSLEKDKYCSACNRRLKFLIFLRDLRELINKEKQLKSKNNLNK